MSDHPAPIELETWYAERLGDHVEAHLEGCTQCREYVRDLENLTASFLADESTEQFLQRPAIAAELNRPAPRSSVARTSIWAWLMPLLAGAAAIALVAIPTESGHLPTPDSPDTVRMKGALQLEVVRWRAGTQTAHTGDVRLMEGDRLRLKIIVSEETTLTVGVLEDGGGWVPLAERRAFAPGPHALPDESLEVDAEPTRGWVLAGSPEDVDRARQTLDFTGLGPVRLFDTSIH